MAIATDHAEKLENFVDFSKLRGKFCNEVGISYEQADFDKLYWVHGDEQ